MMDSMVMLEPTSRRGYGMMTLGCWSFWRRFWSTRIPRRGPTGMRSQSTSSEGVDGRRERVKRSPKVLIGGFSGVEKGVREATHRRGLVGL